MKRKTIKQVYVWTWLCDFGKGPELCRFAMADKKVLLMDGKPTPGAKAVRVRMGYL